MSTAALFESLASRYDELWTDTAVGRAQRSAVWRITDPLFHRGDRVLDIGCGTGKDAAHLADRGVAVHAIDPSAAMAARASARGGFAVQVLAAEDLAQLEPRTFDGAISNFGALNCVADPAGIARSLGALVRPGGSVAICIIGRFCAWETLYYGARFKFRKALRRWPGRAGDIHYPSVRHLRAAFSPDFELQRWTGIGALVPPSYVKLPVFLVNLLAALEPLRFLRSCADHRLLVFVRK